MVNTDTIRERFAVAFERTAPTLLARAPARVNLIGEHTDYNDGYCMPAALNKFLTVAARERNDHFLRAHSTAFEQTASTDLRDESLAPGPPWFAYVGGLALALRKAGSLPGGADLLIHSEIPIGAGLASSAALTVACAKALLALRGDLLDTAEMVSLCAETERQYADTPCGVMDPCTCLMARKNSAMLLDCRSLAVQYLALPQTNARFVLLNPHVAHQNRAGPYARRRRECEDAVAYFQRIDPTIRALRDLDQAMLNRHMTQMDPTVAARCHHVVTENRRVLQAHHALQQCDMAELGRLLNASHASLRDRFDVSCSELDRLAEVARDTNGVYGARMIGGGFGGTVLALCEPDALPRLADAVRKRYDPDAPKPASILEVETADAADWEEL